MASGGPGGPGPGGGPGGGPGPQSESEGWVTENSRLTNITILRLASLVFRKFKRNTESIGTFVASPKEATGVHKTPLSCTSFPTCYLRFLCNMSRFDLGCTISPKIFLMQRQLGQLRRGKRRAGRLRRGARWGAEGGDGGGEGAERSDLQTPLDAGSSLPVSRRFIFLLSLKPFPGPLAYQCRPSLLTTKLRARMRLSSTLTSTCFRFLYQKSLL